MLCIIPLKPYRILPKSLTGLWLNPRTNNKLWFSADQSNAAKGGEINVLQHGTDVPVSLHFDLSASGEKIYMTVEGERYKVSLHDVPPGALYIKLSPGRTLRLLKH